MAFVTVADVDDEDRLDNSLLQICKLGFGHKVKLLFRLWAKGLVKILKLKLRRDFELSQDFELETQARFKADIWSVFCWCLVGVTKLNHNQNSETKLGQDFKFSRDTVCYCLFEILELMLYRDSKNWNMIKMCARTCDKNSTLRSVVPLAMFVLCIVFAFLVHLNSRPF